MKATPTAIADALIIEPKVFGDSRGFFYESFNEEAFNKAADTDIQFVQDNHSRTNGKAVAAAVTRVSITDAILLVRMNPADMQPGAWAAERTCSWPCHWICTTSWILTSTRGTFAKLFNLAVGNAAILSTTSIPLMTLPNTA